MKNWFVLCLFALALGGTVAAASSVDAENFVASSNYFLYDAEAYSAPNVTIRHEGKSYWVVSVTSGTDVITYFPIDAQSGALSDSAGVNRALFEVADNLRELQRLKVSLSSGSGVDWLFTQNYQSIFNEMGINLNDGLFQLNAVESTLKSSNVNADVLGLKATLFSMAQLSTDLSGKVSQANIADNTFVTSPSAENLSAMKAAYFAVFAQIAQLNESGLAYQSGLTRLKNEISVSSLDTQTKAQLEPLLRLPESLRSLRQYNSNATQLRSALDARFSSSSLRTDSLLEQLAQRIAKDRVHKLIYTENPTLRDTGLGSLSKAQAAILAPENRPLWVAQPKVRELDEDYRKAVDHYNKRQFAEAEKSAGRAVDSAVAIYKQGRKSNAPPEQGISQDFLFKAAGALLVLLVILYIFNNRKKVGGIISGKEEEIDLYK